MSRFFSWFREKKTSQPIYSSATRFETLKNLILQKQTRELVANVRTKYDQTVFVDTFFHSLTSIDEREYRDELFDVLRKTLRLSTSQLSTLISERFCKAILAKNFELCERILQLPLPSMMITVGTYELTQFFHQCPSEILFLALPILIAKNLPHDKEYLSWILLLLFEHFLPGDEHLIEFVLRHPAKINPLHICYGNHQMTPLMLFFHLYGNEKCQHFLDNYLENLPEQSVLFLADRWNRSYLTHLLCGKCEHSTDEQPFDIDQPTEHTKAILSRFTMLYQLGNRIDQPVKTILNSQYCLPVRLTLWKYLFDHDPQIQQNFNELFLYLPWISLPSYSNFFKQITRNQNLNSILACILPPLHQWNDDRIDLVRFLLGQGARLDQTDKNTGIIFNYIWGRESLIPDLLLDYSIFANLNFDVWSNHRNNRFISYICRTILCGYRGTFRENFAQYKLSLTENQGKILDRFINLKEPPSLSILCLQKLRTSLKHLGDTNLGELKNFMPPELHRSIRSLGFAESQKCFELLSASP